MRNNFSARLFFLVMFVLLTTSCSSSGQRVPPTVMPNFNEIIFLTDEPCTAPCWKGLEIGVSEEREVLTTVSALNFVDQKTIQIIPKSMPDLNPENWVQGKEIIITCVNRREPCLRLGIANDKLRDIEISLDYGLTLDAVIVHFGAPDYVGYEHMSRDTVDCRVELIWNKYQLVLYSIVFTKPEDVDGRCFAVVQNGTPDASLLVEEVRYVPLEEVNLRIERDQLVDYRGTK